MSGVFSPTRAKIKERTLRTDKWWLEPAITFGVLFSFVIYATFRAFEGANYSFWLSPPACAVAEPHTKYTGETRAPLILQNGHRWFFYAGLVFNVFLTYDAIISFKSVEGQWGHMSVGSLVLVVSSTLLWFYSLSCHTCRHTVGGRLKHFSKHPIRYKIWTWVSALTGVQPKIVASGTHACDKHGE